MPVRTRSFASVIRGSRNSPNRDTGRSDRARPKDGACTADPRSGRRHQWHPCRDDMVDRGRPHRPVGMNPTAGQVLVMRSGCRCRRGRVLCVRLLGVLAAHQPGLDQVEQADEASPRRNPPARPKASSPPRPRIVPSGRLAGPAAEVPACRGPVDTARLLCSTSRRMQRRETRCAGRRMAAGFTVCPHPEPRVPRLRRSRARGQARAQQRRRGQALPRAPPRSGTRRSRRR